MNKFEIENKIRIQLTMDASMRTWWDEIKHLQIPMPKTQIVNLEKNQTLALAKMKKINDIPEKLRDDIFKLADAIGFPLFLRTDQTSCKHFWEETCYVEKREDLFDHIYRLIEESSMLGLMGLPTYALVFRGYIPMDSVFDAFMGMPVNPEWRFFAYDGEILCHHFYWIKEAISFWGREKAENWEEKLDKIMELEEYEFTLLSEYSKQISKELTSRIGGAWSIDFCKSKDGKWYFIDCAPSEISWHPDCEKKELVK